MSHLNTSLINQEFAKFKNQSMMNQSEIDALKQTAKRSRGFDDNRLMKVSLEFESLFLSSLFKEMEKSVQSINPKSTLGKSMGEGIFREMLFDEYAKDIRQDSSLGLAKMVFDALKKG